MAPRRGAVIALLWMGLLALMLVAGAQAARAHAALTGSQPAAGVTLDALPAAVTLSFTEPVAPLSLLWHLPDGRSQTVQGSTVPQGLEVAPPEDVGEGSYSLAWRVASADGHPVSGVVTLSLGAPGGSAAPTATAGSGAVALSLGLRLATLVAMILAVGAALFGRLVVPMAAPAQQIGRVAAHAAPLLALLALGAYGLDLLDLPVTMLPDLAPWQVAIAQPRGASILLMAAAAVLAAAGSRRGGMAVWLAWALAAMSMSLSGHAVAGAWPLAGSLLMTVHAAALVLWVGGLPPLIFAVSGPDGGAALRRFSSLALPAVLALAASGLGLLCLQAGSWQALAASGWGRLMAFKLALVAAMLALALLNRCVLTPALAAAPDRAVPKLRRSIGAEIALGAAVLVVAMGFRLTPPPGTADAAATAAAEGPPGYARLLGADLAVDLDIRPMPPGIVMITAYPGDLMGEALPAQALWLTLSDPAAGLGPIRVEAQRDESGGWRAAPTPLPSAGPWQVSVGLLMSGGETREARGRLAE